MTSHAVYPHTHDFTFHDDGSICTIKPNTNEAEQWILDWIPKDAPMIGGAIGIERRYVGDVLDGIHDDGLTLEEI